LHELPQEIRLSQSFSTLVQWLQHDVLQLAVHPPTDRAILYDFIVDEMTVLAAKHPHRITDIITSLKTQRNALLDVAHTLNDKFLELAEKYQLSIELVWKICYTARYSMDSIKYGITSCELESLIGDEKYDAIEDEVLLILEGTHRCSSMVENLNSRLVSCRELCVNTNFNYVILSDSLPIVFDTSPPYSGQRKISLAIFSNTFIFFICSSIIFSTFF
jgi:hypothetical protein